MGVDLSGGQLRVRRQLSRAAAEPCRALRRTRGGYCSPQGTGSSPTPAGLREIEPPATGYDYDPFAEDLHEDDELIGEREADLHGVIRIVEPDARGDDTQPSFNYFAFDVEGS